MCEIPPTSPPQAAWSLPVALTPPAPPLARACPNHVRSSAAPSPTSHPPHSPWSPDQPTDKTLETSASRTAYPRVSHPPACESSETRSHTHPAQPSRTHSPL